MSTESFITPEIIQSGTDISTRGARLADMANLVTNEAVETNISGEVSLIGAIHAVDVQASAKQEKVAKIKAEQLEVVGEAVDLLGSLLHDDWRVKNFGNEDGTFRPRVKCLVERGEQQEWINENQLEEGEVVMLSQDIAKTAFRELDPYWQKDNRGAAQTVVEIIVARNGDIDLSDPETYEQIGHEIHEAWLSRAGWIEPGLEKPFSELSTELRERDINQMRLALTVFNLKSE